MSCTRPHLISIETELQLYKFLMQPPIFSSVFFFVVLYLSSVHRLQRLSCLPTHMPLNLQYPLDFIHEFIPSLVFQMGGCPIRSLCLSSDGARCFSFVFTIGLFSSTITVFNSMPRMHCLNFCFLFLMIRIPRSSS